MGVRSLVCALALLLLAGTSAQAANPLIASWLLPGGGKLDHHAIAQSRFCALTFDDGPDARYTAQVAAVLDHYGVKATFFVVGKHVAQYPDVVKALYADGHEIGNHSWSHPDFTKLSDKECRTEVMRCQAQLAKLGITAHWMRPPYGAFDRGVVKDIKGADMTPVLWSVDPRDWEQPGIGKIESRVLGAAGNGSVILMHSTNAQTVAALPRIIETLKARGYQFLTISQWETAASGHGVPETAPAPLVRIPKTPKTAPSLRQVEPLPSLPAPVGPIGPGLLAHAEPAVSAAADVELRGDSVDDVAISAPPLEIATADGEPAAEPAPESVPAAAEPQPASPVAAPVTEPQMAALPVPGPWLHVISNFDAAGELLGSLFIGPLQPSQPR